MKEKDYSNKKNIYFYQSCKFPNPNSPFITRANRKETYIIISSKQMLPQSDNGKPSVLCSLRLRRVLLNELYAN